MRKGYPALEHYGKPADAIEEVDSTVSSKSGGTAEGVDEDSAFKARDGESEKAESGDDDVGGAGNEENDEDSGDYFDDTPASIKTRDYSKEASELCESFEKKIDFVTDLWRQIESPEVADLPLAEFRYRATQMLTDLERVVSNSHNLRAECEKKIKEIREVTVAIESENIKKKRGEAIPEGLIDILKSKQVKLREGLRGRLNNPDFEFVHHFLVIISGIYLKKTKIEPLRELPIQQDKAQAGLEFCRRLESFGFESEYGYDSRCPTAVNENIKRLLDFLKAKVAAGENIFNFIKIDPYDIVFNLDREDFDKIYISKNFQKKDGKQGQENKDLKVLGVNFPNTPIILLAKGDKDISEEHLRGTEIHEKGHNLIGITEEVEGFDIHNVVYQKSFVNGLRNKDGEFKKLYEEGKSKDAEDVVRKYMRKAINKLNGEISADAKNIVLGYPETIAFYVRELIFGLDQYVAEYSKVVLPEAENKIKNLFLDIVQEETRSMIAKGTDLFVKMTTYAYVARKYGLEDEFCSALVLMPDSEKYLSRILSIKLGDKFDFVLANREINPAKLFAGAPWWLKNGFSKYFGPNSVAVG
jgi:hypothetical protein